MRAQRACGLKKGACRQAGSEQSLFAKWPVIGNTRERKRRGRSMQGLLKGCYSERVRERAVITKAEGFFIGEKARGGSVDSGFDALRFRSRCTFLCLSLSVCVC